MQNTSRRLRTPEAAAYLGVSTSFLAKLRVYGSPVPYSKLGRSVVYDVRDLDAWLEQNRRTSTSELVASAETKS